MSSRSGERGSRGVNLDAEGLRTALAQSVHEATAPAARFEYAHALDAVEATEDRLDDGERRRVVLQVLRDCRAWAALLGLLPCRIGQHVAVELGERAVDIVQ